MILAVIWLAAIMGVLYLYIRQKYRYFDNHNIKYITPIPILGNMHQAVLAVRHQALIFKELYDKYPKERFVGHYDFTSPVIMIRDLDLIKQITVKNFDNFYDHRFSVKKEKDPIFGNVLFTLKGHQWRTSRTTVSPAFTSSKMKLMVPFMMEVGDQVVNSLNKSMRDTGASHLDVELKDLAMRYANDAIASCAFGMKVDSLDDKDNTFFKMGQEISSFKFDMVIKFLGFQAFPKLMELLNFKLFSEKVTGFFKDVITDAIKHREENDIYRPDMVHLLMEAKNGKLKSTDTAEDFHENHSSLVEDSLPYEWSDDALTSQAVTFFVAGIEGISSTVGFLFHELAFNPDIQERLYQEIMESHRKNNGKFDYNTMLEMKYLDMVVSELLRKWPPGVSLDRICTKPFNLGKVNEKSEKDYIMSAGDGINIPVYAIHRDPQYFPEPEKFDPERFSEENKHKILPFTYLPFGAGPRNCIGNRFALCGAKVMIYQVLRKMAVAPCAKSCPIEFAADTFNLRAKDKLWLKFIPRDL